ncbi:MAG TPA: hypothetical protein PLP06_12915 [Saprospiraceae bacterium]|nr:hypothetical protein [Saprospiraceae bacterium]
MELLGIGSRLKHASYQEGVVIRLNPDTYDICFMAYGVKQIAKSYDKFEIIEHIEVQEEIDYTEVEKSLIRILQHWGGMSERVELGDKWKGGKMILVPSNRSLKDKEIPIETFFHKIVMLRDRVRVMEQKINSNSKLTDEEKIDIQQYITRIYGSLTTFNVLFKSAEHNFVGERSTND